MELPSPDAFDDDGGEEEEDEEEKARIQEEMERMEEAQEEEEANKKFEFFREPPPKSWWPWSAAAVVDRGPVNAPVTPLGASSSMAVGGGNAASAAGAAGGGDGGGTFGRMFSWLPWSGTTTTAPREGTLALPDDETIAIAGADKRRRQGLETEADGQHLIGGDEAVEGGTGEKKKKKRKTPRAITEQEEVVERGGNVFPAPRLRAVEGAPGEGKEAEEKEDQYTLGAYLMAPLSLIPWSSSSIGGGAVDEGERKGAVYQGEEKGDDMGGEKKQKQPKASKNKKKAKEEERDEEKGTKGHRMDGEIMGDEESNEEANLRAAEVSGEPKGTIASRAARMMSMFTRSPGTSDTAAKIGLPSKEMDGEEVEEEEGEGEGKEQKRDNIDRASRAARLMSMFSLSRVLGEKKGGEGQETEQNNGERGEGEEEGAKVGENEGGEEEGEGKEEEEGGEEEEKKPRTMLQKLKNRLQTEDGEPDDLEALADRLVGALSNGEINLATYRMAKRYAKGRLLKKLVEKERERAYKIMKRKERREAEKNMTWGEYFKSKVNLKQLMPKIKILITVFQIVGALPATIGITFGGGAGSIFSIFGAVNVGGVSFGSPQCYAAYDYVDRFATQLYHFLPYATLKMFTTQSNTQSIFFICIHIRTTV